MNENYLGFPKGIEARRLRALGKQQAERFGVVFCRAKVTTIEMEDDVFRACAGRYVFRGRTVIPRYGRPRHMFSELGCEPRTEIAEALGVKLAKNGFIETDPEQRTNVKHVYAAGDVTRFFAHQIRHRLPRRHPAQASPRTTTRAARNSATSGCCQLVHDKPNGVDRERTSGSVIRPSRFRSALLE